MRFVYPLMVIRWSGTDLDYIVFEAGTGSGNYNAVKMKAQLEDILAGFESTTSNNAHVLAVLWDGFVDCVAVGT